MLDVLLRRHGDGIGDWLFMLAAIKHITDRHMREVRVSVDFQLPKIGRQDRELSKLVIDAYKASDVPWVNHQDLRAYDVEVKHVVYERISHEHYIEGMVKQLDRALLVPLTYNPKLLPHFSFNWASWPRPEYFVMPSQGKKATAHKDWGIDRFEALAKAIYEKLGCRVVQIGASNEYLLQGAHVDHANGERFADVAKTLSGAVGYIGLENGPTVLAAMLGVPTACIYMASLNKGRIGLGETLLLRPSVDEALEWCRRQLDAHRAVPLQAIP